MLSRVYLVPVAQALSTMAKRRISITWQLRGLLLVGCLVPTPQIPDRSDEIPVPTECPCQACGSRSGPDPFVTYTNSSGQWINGSRTAASGLGMEYCGGFHVALWGGGLLNTRPSGIYLSASRVAGHSTLTSFVLDLNKHMSRSSHFRPRRRFKSSSNISIQVRTFRLRTRQDEGRITMHV